MDLIAGWTVKPHRNWGGRGELVATGNVLFLSLGSDVNICYVYVLCSIPSLKKLEHGISELKDKRNYLERNGALKSGKCGREGKRLGQVFFRYNGTHVTCVSCVNAGSDLVGLWGFLRYRVFNKLLQDISAASPQTTL